MHTISLTLELFPLGAALDDATGDGCPRCRRPLSFHQPDPNWPDRLVVTCSSCRAWFLIDGDAGRMIRLPDGPELRGM